MLALIQELHAQLPNLTARPDDMPKVFAVAALARATRLLEAMGTLRDAGLADVVGIGLRPILELVTACLHCLTGGMTAANELRGANVRDLRNLSPTVTEGTPTNEIVAEWAGATDRINWEQLMARVGRAMAEQFPAEQLAITFMVELYNGQYRGTSMQDIHGGPGSFGPHIVHGLSFSYVLADGYEPDDGTGSLLLGASLTALAMHFVFRRYGVSTTRLDAIQQRLNEGAGADAIIREAP